MNLFEDYTKVSAEFEEIKKKYHIAQEKVNYDILREYFNKHPEIPHIIIKVIYNVQDDGMYFSGGICIESADGDDIEKELEEICLQKYKGLFPGFHEQLEWPYDDYQEKIYVIPRNFEKIDPDDFTTGELDDEDFEDDED